jgi:hypothetical protein
MRNRMRIDYIDPMTLNQGINEPMDLEVDNTS